jgi:HprK-related kinase B
MPELEKLAAELVKQTPPAHRLGLELSGWTCRVESNSAELIEKLKHYFKPCLAEVETPAITIVAIQTPPPEFGVDYTDWPREPGKTGRKEEFADIEGGRMIHKVRTGMQFLLGETTRLAVGPCLENDNQIINFILTQHISSLLADGCAICHAAAIEHRGKGLMFAGLSGGGKSTLALHLMSRGASFTSNDRVMVKKLDSTVQMYGIPKLPRINPGTALNNPDLDSILTDQRKAELARLGKDELWQLEEKYDVYIDECFGEDRFAYSGHVDALFVLNWDRNSTETTILSRAQLADRPDLLGAVMKSPGPFWIPRDGSPPSRKPEVDPDDYLPHLADLKTFEIKGRADFELACDLVEGALEEL